MLKQAVDPIRLFAPIIRVDEEKRTVEAYAFVNEVVDGEGGIRLKRSAMEAATNDYMTWANIRRMHQADAVGVAESVVWDQTGAKMVVKVVDDDAWAKVKERVYKGLSVGVAATIMRGKDVEACRWFETSLVDRPKDPGALITAIRAEGIADGAEHQADVYEDGEELPAAEEDGDLARGAFADKMAKREAPMRRGLAFDILYGELERVCRDGGVEDPEAAAREIIAEFAEYVTPLVATRQMPEEMYYGEGITADVLTRYADATAGMLSARDREADAIRRAETAEASIARFEADLTAARAEVETLKRRSDPAQQKPVRVPQALERTIAAGGNPLDPAADATAKQVDVLRAELAELTEKLPSEQDAEKRTAGVVRMQRIKMQLADLGA